METKIRKQIYIDPEQNEYLKRVSERLGISEAEIIRQALMAQTRTLHQPGRNLVAWERECEFIDSLIRQGAVPGGRSWKREDLYDR